MVKIFLSYARDNEEIARALATALERAGHSVWWDRHIRGGSQYAEEIEAELDRADKVLVLWSPTSVKSAWVRDEAAAARDSGRLVPLAIGSCMAPLGFRQFQTIDVKGWKGRGPMPGAELLADTLEAPGAARKSVAVAVANDGRKWRIVSGAVALLIVLAVGVYALKYRIGFGSGDAKIALAVLPFEAVPADDTNSPFADGVSEEILGQLARNPKLQLTGRTSAAMFKGGSEDAPTIGSKLHVDYLLDGSVRRAGNAVKVAVGLVRAKDGVQLWSHVYNGSLDDIFAIQQRIGQEVEGQLRARFVGTQAVTAASLSTRAETYSTFLRARELLRLGQPEETNQTVTILQGLLKADPNYAPAWALLAEAMIDRQQWSNEAISPAQRRQIISFADRALHLAPGLGAAHAAKSLAIDDGTSFNPAILRETQLAAQIDPSSSDAWKRLANLEHRYGNYPAELIAWRRAVQIDPLWFQTFYNASESAWQLGYEKECLAYVVRVENEASPLPFMAYMVRADMAARRGELAGQLKYALLSARVADPGRLVWSHIQAQVALYNANNLEQARAVWAGGPVNDTVWSLWHLIPPTPARLKAMFADPVAAWNDINMSLLLPALIAKGRSGEVVALFRARYQSVGGFLRDGASHGAILNHGPSIAVALQVEGLLDEAGNLLDRLKAETDRRVAAGPVPRWYPYQIARIEAVRGHRDAALAYLAQAERRGFHVASMEALHDLREDPALASLRTDRRFLAIVARDRAWMSRQQQAIAPMLSQLDLLKPAGQPVKGTP